MWGLNFQGGVNGYSLYHQRWNVEVDIRSIKTHMGMEMLSCLSPEMVKKEIAIYFIAYNLIRSIIAQSAVIHEKIPRKISFKSTVQLIVAGATTIIRIANQHISTYYGYGEYRTIGDIDQRRGNP